MQGSEVRRWVEERSEGVEQRLDGACACLSVCLSIFLSLC